MKVFVNMKGMSQKKLSEIFKRINAGEDPQKLKTEIKEILRDIKPEDFAMAEQDLINDGLAPEDLRHLCAAHIELMDEQNQSSRPPAGHPVNTFMAEHDEILHFLDMLEILNAKVQTAKSNSDLSVEDKDKLAYVAKHLEAAEPHHKREEDILFPAMEERGVFGPPEMMRMEHVDLRANKKALNELVKKIETMDFKDFQTNAKKYSEFIIFNLRDHIFKENNILYPTALDVIQDQKIWDDIKKKCDKIGYCCFTPAA